MKGALILGGAVALMLGGASPADAQADTGTVRDTSAIQALERMGAYLRSLPAVQVKAQITREEVLTNGEKVQTSSESELIARKPDRLRVEVRNQKQPREMYYDGKKFSMYAPRLKYYSSVDAPPTIGALLDSLEDRFELELPLVDLVRWGTERGNTDEVWGARDVGTAVVDGIPADQYAFRQNGADWQLWIQSGEYPLPLKVVITTLTDAARPQYTAQYKWNLAPSFNEAAFAFEAPADAKPIKLAERLKAKPQLPEKPE
jgi:hypothetical protein